LNTTTEKVGGPTSGGEMVYQTGDLATRYYITEREREEPSGEIQFSTLSCYIRPMEKNTVDIVGKLRVINHGATGTVLYSR
jgi:hypothetical protein